MSRISNVERCWCCGNDLPESTGARRCVVRVACYDCKKQGHTGFDCQKCKQILEEELRESADELFGS